jgi:hypothetical protein
MKNTPNNNRTQQTAGDQHLIDGFTHAAASITSLVIASAAVTTKDIVATLQSRIDSRKTVESARAAWQSAVQADRDLTDKTKPFVAAVRASLLASFAGNIDALTKFGLTPRQKPVTTPEVKVAAAAKAKATRDARHTMGPKQKARVKGTVTPTAPATFASTAPAPSPTQPVVTPVAPVPSTAQPAPPAALPITVAPSPITPAPSQAATPGVTPAPRIS